MFCPKCGRFQEDGGLVCSNCDADLTAPARSSGPNKKNILIPVLVILLAAALVCAAAFFVISYTEIQRYIVTLDDLSRAAIDNEISLDEARELFVGEYKINSGGSKSVAVWSNVESTFYDLPISHISYYLGRKFQGQMMISFDTTLQPELKQILEEHCQYDPETDEYSYGRFSFRITTGDTTVSIFIRQ